MTMRRVRAQALAFAMTAVAATGCAGYGVDDAGGAADVVGATWELVELDGAAVAPVGERGRPTLRLDADGRAAGFAGCNQYFGAYTLAGDSLRFGDLGMTRIWCQDVMEAEQASTAASQRAQVARRSGGSSERWIVSAARTPSAAATLARWGWPVMSPAA
jgi:heat shock protein HslJ